MLVLPDGVTKIEIRFADGRTLSGPVSSNGFLFQGHGVRSFAWATRASI